MAHVPHLYVAGPWNDAAVDLDDSAVHHLDRVLRVRDGASLSYTDGVGRMGIGSRSGRSLLRGNESTIPEPQPRIVMAVAAPRSNNRQRFVVEKLAELGVNRLTWLATRHGEGREPRVGKATAWAIQGLQQSRRAHLMSIGGPIGLGELGRPLVVADPSGTTHVGEAGLLPDATFAIGPEAGFAPDEIPSDAVMIGLGESILRVETAAISLAATLRLR